MTGWITDRIGDDPFCPSFIDTMINNNGPLLNNGRKNMRKQGLIRLIRTAPVMRGKSHFTLLRVIPFFIDFYWPRTKLRQGNVFSRVCLSVCQEGVGSQCNHSPWCYWDLLPRHVQGCLIHYTGTPLTSTHIGNVGKRTVGLRMKGFLVYNRWCFVESTTWRNRDVWLKFIQFCIKLFMCFLQHVTNDMN